MGLRIAVSAPPWRGRISADVPIKKHRTAKQKLSEYQRADEEQAQPSKQGDEPRPTILSAENGDRRTVARRKITVDAHLGGY